jgi:hypothetical protein
MPSTILVLPIHVINFVLGQISCLPVSIIMPLTISTSMLNSDLAIFKSHHQSIDNQDLRYSLENVFIASKAFAVMSEV